MILYPSFSFLPFVLFDLASLFFPDLPPNEELLLLGRQPDSCSRGPPPPASAAADRQLMIPVLQVSRRLRSEYDPSEEYIGAEDIKDHLNCRSQSSFNKRDANFTIC